jgi:hypothetical protein
VMEMLENKRPIMAIATCLYAPVDLAKVNTIVLFSFFLEIILVHLHRFLSYRFWIPVLGMKWRRMCGIWMKEF